MNALRIAVLCVALSFIGCADLQPLQDHVAELQTQQEVTQKLVQRLITRLAAGLVQVEEARKELQRLQQAEGR